MDERLERMRKCFRPWQWWNEGDPSPESLEDTLMWVYRKEGDKYVVGYYLPDRTYFSESSYDTAEYAAARVNFLNGGNKK